MKVPQKLRPGDRVGLVAPCSHQPRGRERLVAEAIAILESWGLHVKLQPGWDLRHFYLAGNDRHRAGQFQDFYTDSNLKALFVTRGGYGASRILRFMDSSAIAGHQKIVVGSSDATSLLLYLQKICRMVVFHGPNLATAQFLESVGNQATQQSLYDTLFSAKHLPLLPVQALRHGKATGVLTGGCLSLVVASLGTFYEIETEGKILFLEDTAEAPYRVDRMLTHLKNAEKLDNLQGLILGEMVGCEGPDSILWEMLNDFFKDVRFPVACKLPSGHGPVSVTLPLGSLVSLDADKGWFQVLQ